MDYMQISIIGKPTNMFRFKLYFVINIWYISSDKKHSLKYCLISDCAFYCSAGGIYSNRSAMEQFSVWQIRIRTSVSSRVMVLLMYPFSWERWISAFWQNLFLLKPDSLSSCPKWILILPFWLNFAPPCRKVS